MTRSTLFFVAALVGSSTALWPQPQSITTGSKAVKISSSFDITLEGITNAPQDLLDAIENAKNAIANDKLERLVVGRGSVDADAFGQGAELNELVVSLENVSGDVRSISEEAVDAIENRAEGYTLSVPDDGSAATLTANSTLGLYRGLTTFQQLWYFWDDTVYSVEAPVQITDSPKYVRLMWSALVHQHLTYPSKALPWTYARYRSKLDIKRTLDAMSMVKINTFHWHVVDSQSFPLQIPGFLELSEKGAYSPSSVYTQEDVKDIIAYAAARGIDVLAEIDTPGHTSIIHNVFPEHIACHEKTPWATYANEPPAGQLRLASPETVNFTASLIDAAAALFQSKLFSTGGDEVNQKCYQEDSETQEQLSASGKTLEGALGDFVGATHEVLHAQGKSAVVWQEMVLDHTEVKLRNDSVILVWISSDDVKAVAQKGFKLVHAASDYFYLDCGHGGWVGDFPTGNSWCDPFKTWQKAYSFNPTANLTESEAQLVLGGQQLLWTEQAGPQNLDDTVWPRAASSAEVFWSGPGGNISAALPRLHDIAFRMNKRGIDAIPLQPLYCALRPGVCDLTA
ncbi:Glucosamine-6-phosphate isomerase (Glucosamine-6-phosphate deaminase) (GNPDA) (GlcN6P deaminase) [Marasmius sp. AFHP31]|nr:Glucosamine-6-phosphate isomerase (Glucosamine-6-phosphate deaminase) (GNPDA) (GlcN6P deaminase) [Marasmius sp. AFHP31]